MGRMGEKMKERGREDRTLKMGVPNANEKKNPNKMVLTFHRGQGDINAKRKQTKTKANHEESN